MKYRMKVQNMTPILRVLKRKFKLMSLENRKKSKKIIATSKFIKMLLTRSTKENINSNLISNKQVPLAIS